MRRSFLFAPSIRRGNGTGHLQRAIALMNRLKEAADLRLYLPGDEADEEMLALVRAKGVDEGLILREERSAGRDRFDFVLVDRRSCSLEEYERFSSFGLPIGLDEGGPCRSVFPYLIDSFPLPPEYGRANRRDPAFLDLPLRLRERPNDFRDVLVSFGGEDPARLTEKLLLFLDELFPGSSAGKQPASLFSRTLKKLTVVQGPLFGREVSIPEGLRRREDLDLRRVKAPRDLEPLFAEHELVITSFGLTAYEAAAAGNAVLLFHPSDYHRRLSRLAGFVSAAACGERYMRGALEKAFADPKSVSAATQRVAAGIEGPGLLAELLLSLSVPELSSCPLCKTRSGGEPGTSAPRVLYRGQRRSFFRCPDCGLVYQIDLENRGRRYGGDYFEEEYRAQYGKSYLEDVPQIRRLSTPRVQRIRRLLSPGGGKAAAGRSSAGRSSAPALLDIGCAFGPFLQEAADAGFDVAGMDISEEAVEYVRHELGLPAFLADFSAEMTEGLTERLFDALTMWYVIEHFSRLDLVLRRVSRLLRPGGVFAFSSPNRCGVSGRFRPEAFFAASPADHHSLWSPEAARKILDRYGFCVKKIVSTGHHPQRFPLFGLHMEKTKLLHKPLFHFVGGISRMGALGDTFEVYAQKRGE
jgi:2-polyprenyl-3-methyl-5-hydroxy-6-metoxy-1,4-benzoquinol methylase/spore coat polysaccharide biosynthesis predicted glycosyltransferase SpsG